MNRKFWEDQRDLVTDTSHLLSDLSGNYQGNNKSKQKNKVSVKISISTKITGYTLAYIYGRHKSDDSKKEIEYNVIVVPTYQLTIHDSNGKHKGNFNVTRDSWYSRGMIDEKPDYDPFPPYDRFILTNRYFNPINNNDNVYFGLGQDYPHKGLEAFALTQKGGIEIPAECHSVQQNTYLDGTSVEGARANLCVAKGVLIHIGGWYYNANNEYNKLAGSEGCFGFIPDHQIFKSESGATNAIKKSSYKDWKTSNEDYKQFMNLIKNTRGSVYNLVEITVNHRNDVTVNKDYGLK